MPHMSRQTPRRVARAALCSDIGRPRRTATATAIGACWLVTGAHLLAAQTAARLRPDLFVSASVGAGLLYRRFDSPATGTRFSETAAGGTGVVSIGLNLPPVFVVGLDLAGWRGSNGRNDLGASLLVGVRPGASSSPQFHAGLGLFRFDENANVSVVGNGQIGAAGSGYRRPSFQLGAQWVVAAGLRWSGGLRVDWLSSLGQHRA